MTSYVISPGHGKLNLIRVLRIPDHRSAGIQCFKLCYFRITQRKIKYIDILLNTLHMDRLRNNSYAILNLEAEQNLGRSFSMGRCDCFHRIFPEHLVSPSLPKRRVCLMRHTKLLQPLMLRQIVPIENDEQRFWGLDKFYDFLVGPYNSEIGEADYPFIPIGKYHFCIAMPRKHFLSKKKTLSFSDLTGNQLMIMKRGNSEVNDQIRTEIESNYPDIELIDIPPHYSIHTFNRCVENNSMLLSLECWKEVHPGLITIPLTEYYGLPYGILTSKNPTTDLTEFIAYLQSVFVKTL